MEDIHIESKEKHLRKHREFTQEWSPVKPSDAVR